MDQAAGRKLVSDNMHELKTESNRVEQEAIRARQVIDQRLKGFEDAGAWTTKDLAIEFSESGRQCTESRSSKSSKNSLRRWSNAWREWRRLLES